MSFALGIGERSTARKPHRPGTSRITSAGDVAPFSETLQSKTPQLNKFAVADSVTRT